MEIALVVPEGFGQNRIFKPGMRDNANNRFILLKEGLEKSGFRVSTSDMVNQKNLKLQIQIDSNARSSTKPTNSQAKDMLIISESPIICPQNHRHLYRKKFDRILTWETNSKEENSYWLGCGCSFVHDIEDIANYTNHRQKQICLIAGNKASTQKGELYSARKKAMKYFEKLEIGLDLYGPGWETRRFKGILKPLNKMPRARHWGYTAPKCYIGTIENKFHTLRDYEFSLAFENSFTQNGYITEKIFDSIFSGCIPIYKGANNIGDYIPEECYINANNTKDYQSLGEIISKLGKDERQRMRMAMHEFSREFKKSSYFDQIWAQEVIAHCHALIKGQSQIKYLNTF